MAYLISKTGPIKGFHSVSSTTIYLPSPYNHHHYDQCSLYIYYTLPPLLFVDTHELSQRNESYTFSHWGSRDLEKPGHALPDEVSELLVNVRLPLFEADTSVKVNVDGGEEQEGRMIHVEVPMHMRYGLPKTADGSDPEQGLYERIRVDWPQGFFRCPPTSNVLLYFVRFSGIDGYICDSALLKTKTSMTVPPHILATFPSQANHVLIPIPPHVNFSSSETFTDLYLPLGNTEDLAFVEPITALTILACCFWVFRMAFKTFSRLNNQTRRPKTS